MSKELKARYISIVAPIFNKEDKTGKWEKYFYSEIADVVELSGGMLIAIEKSKLEKSFCFGYSTCGQGNTFDEAIKAEASARNNANYFMAKNTRACDLWIEELKGNRFSWYARTAYYTLPDDSPIKSLKGFTEWDWQQLPENEKAKYTKLSKADTKTMINAWKEEKARHVNRCKTYLKRYGTKHLNTWTYWIDE